jgi:hypothetical protein
MGFSVLFDIEFHLFSSSKTILKLRLRFEGFFTMNPMCYYPVQGVHVPITHGSASAPEQRHLVKQGK